MTKKPFFSVIIPIRFPTAYLKETLFHLHRQSYKHFEIIIVSDKISKSPDPGSKRNIGAKKSRGNYLAFLDDDSFPSTDWLKNCSKIIIDRPDISCFCGPCLTPAKDSFFQQVSGLFYESFSGSGGAGTYRNSAKSPRFVDDYPSVNIIINKKLFNKVGGFKNEYWPGEDTIFCLEIVKKLHEKIYYHPSIVVFHHRRPILLPHLQQIKRYALHRGFFAKTFPETSFRFGYFLPSLFLIYLILLPLFFRLVIFQIPFYFYISLLFFEHFEFIFSKKSFLIPFLCFFVTIISHLYYGLFFFIGITTPKLISKPHQIDQITGNYLGG